MARGWESKSVEDQVGAREAELEARARPVLSPEELELRAKRDGLLLSRARLVADIASATNDRYRQLLERSLAHVDAELAALDTAP